MKATKEEIIASAKKIIEQVWRDKIIEKTIQIKEKKVEIFAFGYEGYYEHDGWFFMVKQAEFPEDSIMIYFLEDGTPIRTDYLVTDATGRSLYIIKDEEGNYKGLLNKEDYLKHHNFDFTKKGFEFIKYKTY